jgi:hypothetical protein
MKKETSNHYQRTHLKALCNDRVKQHKIRQTIQLLLPSLRDLGRLGVRMEEAGDSVAAGLS